jgi:hypothetical protein
VNECIAVKRGNCDSNRSPYEDSVVETRTVFIERVPPKSKPFIVQQLAAGRVCARDVRSPGQRDSDSKFAAARASSRLNLSILCVR